METIHGLNIHGPAIIGTGVAFTVLAVLGVGLRFASKRVAHASLGLDDWLLFAALLIYVAAEILVIRSDILGRKATSPEDRLYSTYMQYVYLYSIFYFVVIALVEVSILFFYRRIFFPSSFRIISMVLIGFCGAWCFTALVIEIGYPSHPIGYYFHGGPQTKLNVNYLTFWLAMAIIEVLLEVVILVLPIRELYRLQLSSRKKFLCSLIFALGGFVIITGIIRIAKVYKPGSADVDLTQGDIWLNVHLGTAIICACLPTYRPLVSRTPWLSFDSLRGHRKPAGSDDTHQLPTMPKSVHHSDSHDLMEAIYTGQQQDLQGNFVDARRSGSTNATRSEWQDEGPVRTGAAIGVKHTVEVV
ncbi:MAG: hypothetical protein Q9166_005289 [cf. Caloplaca sp. 2 TL-2023]